MTNIAEIVNETSTVRAVDLAYEAGNVQRQRLGLSQAGHKCKRVLWYTHRGYNEPQTEGRILRLFQLGNILEDQTIADLQGAGFNIHSQQKHVEIEMEGTTLHGSIDGIIESLIEAPKTPHLFEHKTCSLKRFNELLKKGYRKFSETYYWQTQFYMLGLGLKRTAAFVYCKDDSRLYMERIPLNKDATVDRLQDVFRAISSDMRPERACPRADWWESRFCAFRRECWRLS